MQREETRHSQLATYIGLDLGGEFTRVTVLDAAGELLEEGIVRSTEAGFRQRFASLPPSLVSLQYDDRNARLLSLLSELGHSLLIAGPLPEQLRPALMPAVERFTEQGRRHGATPQSLVLKRSGEGTPLGFWIDGDSAWYFMGPVAPASSFSSPSFRGLEPVEHVPSSEQARRLHSLCLMGEISFAAHQQIAAA